jgi:hypothetical protein
MGEGMVLSLVFIEDREKYALYPWRSHVEDKGFKWRITPNVYFMKCTKDNHFFKGHIKTCFKGAHKDMFPIKLHRKLYLMRYT